MNYRYEVILAQLKEQTKENLRWVLGWEGIYCISDTGNIYKKNKYNSIFNKKEVSKKDGQSKIILTDLFKVREKQTVIKDKMIYEAFFEKLEEGFQVIRDISKHNNVITKDEFEIKPLNNSSKTIGYYIDGKRENSWESISKAARYFNLDKKVILDWLNNEKFQSNLPFRIKYEV